MPLASSASWHPRTWHLSTTHQPRDPAGAADLVGPLAFSIAGLLLNDLALMVQGVDRWLVLSGLALTAGVPALAAMAVLHFGSHVD
jgi:hypothetical protein